MRPQGAVYEASKQTWTPVWGTPKIAVAYHVIAHYLLLPILPPYTSLNNCLCAAPCVLFMTPPIALLHI